MITYCMDCFLVQNRFAHNFERLLGFFYGFKSIVLRYLAGLYAATCAIPNLDRGLR